MTYVWEFETAGRLPEPEYRRCHRGKMILLEEVMAARFTRVPNAELLRNRTLDHIVSTPLRAVQTRETILRTLHSNLAAIFVDLVNQQKNLEVLICEKRNSIPIDNELRQYDLLYENVALSFSNYRIKAEYVGMIVASLKSTNAVLRVAARCAIVVMSAIIEMRG
jgi:hypothetical protein